MSSYLDRLVKPFGFKSYGHYLQSEQWQNFRQWVRKDCCHCCGSKDKLQVHHKTYVNICRECPDDVVTVCGSCHEKIHELRRSGFPLAESHIELKKEKPTNANRKCKWVHWKGLLNRSARQTITDLQMFLTSKGLFDEERLATAKAIDLEFARIEPDGRTRWNQGRYISMMQSDKKVGKIIAAGGVPHVADLKRALHQNR